MDGEIVSLSLAAHPSVAHLVCLPVWIRDLHWTCPRGLTVFTKTIGKKLVNPFIADSSTHPTLSWLAIFWKCLNVGEEERSQTRSADMDLYFYFWLIIDLHFPSDRTSLSPRWTWMKDTTENKKKTPPSSCSSPLGQYYPLYSRVTLDEDDFLTECSEVSVCLGSSAPAPGLCDDTRCLEKDSVSRKDKESFCFNELITPIFPPTDAYLVLAHLCNNSWKSRMLLTNGWRNVTQAISQCRNRCLDEWEALLKVPVIKLRETTGGNQ